VKLTELTHRLRKIGKIAASVTLFGFAGQVVADDLNLQSGLSLSVSGSTSFVNVYRDDGENEVFDTTDDYTGTSASITLASGVDLSGVVPIGTVRVAVYSRDSDNTNGFDIYRFDGSGVSTLTLNGNNDIVGVVGYHFDNNGGGDAFGNYIAGGDDALTTININGANVVFNSDVNASRIEVNQGGALTFNANIDAGGSAATTLDFNNHNVALTLDDGVTLTGSIVKDSGTQNGTIIFTGQANITGSVAGGSGSIGQITLQGGSDDVEINGSATTDRVEFEAQTVFAVGGSLDMSENVSGSAFNGIDFNDDSGTVQVGGNLTGIADKIVATTDLNNTGTLTFLSGSQAVTGDIGSSSASIGLLNVGGAYQSGTIRGLDGNDSVRSDLTVGGDVFAANVRLNEDGSSGSVLTMANDYGITGDVTVEVNQRGGLVFAGGEQTMTGDVGGSGAELASVSAGANASDVTNFTADLFANTLSVGGGTVNLNTASGATTTSDANVDFTAAGTLNLNQGLIGSVDFTTDATVNLINASVVLAGTAPDNTLSGDRAISGTFTTDVDTSADGAGRGVLNVDSSGTLSPTGGTGTSFNTAIHKISALNLNTGAASRDYSTADDSANYLTQLNGDLFADAIVLNDGAELQVADGVDITADITSAVNTALAPVVDDLATESVDESAFGDSYTDNVLDLQGNHTVTGSVGSAANPLTRIDAGVGDGTTNSLSTFAGGVVYADTLDYNEGQGEVRFNGDGTAANGGFIGTVVLTAASGATESDAVFALGDDVNLYTQNLADDDINAAKRTTFEGADLATLRFYGTSEVFGVVGSAGASETQTFLDIEAGADGETVTFNDDVYVGGTTLEVTGTGIVNLLGNLNGPIEFQANGSVNLADGRVITGAVTTDTDDQGVLNLVGGHSTQATIGTSALSLNEINLHASSTDTSVVPVSTGEETINLGHSLFATDVTVGNANSATTLNLTADVGVGDNLTLSNNTTFNLVGDIQTSSIGGTLTSANGPWVATLNNGTLVANNATLNFAIAGTAWDATNGGGLVDSSGSSAVTSASGTLDLSGTETINVSLLSSMRDGQTFAIFDGTSVTGTVSTIDDTVATFNDNSYAIDSTLTNVSGDLVLTTDRDANTYVTKSGLTNHFATPVAVRLGELAAAGTGYTADMQTIFNKVDLDNWGFGNNQVNLARQMELAAPVVNNSIALASFDASILIGDELGSRMQALRLPEPGTDPAGWWIRAAVGEGEAESVKSTYAGYETSYALTTVGVDMRLTDTSIVGLAANFGSTTLEQHGVRAGDEASLQSTMLSLYGAVDLYDERLTLSGNLTGGNFDTQSKRSAMAGTVASGNYDQELTSAKLAASYEFPIKGLNATISPVLEFERANLDQPAYVETGAEGSNLDVLATSLDRSQVGLGLRYEQTALIGGMVVKPEVQIMATQMSGNFVEDVRASFVGDQASEVFTVATPDEQDYDRSGLSLKLGATLLMSENSSLVINLDRRQTGDNANTSFNLTSRWEF